MNAALAWNRLPTFARFRAEAWPKEHGSWSLALEPIALGLAATPSLAGAWLSAAVVAAFLARRPLRTAWREPRGERRREAARVLAVLAIIALASTAVAISLAGFAWLLWLLPIAALGARFLSFDLRNAGREGAAEVAGAAAFAFLPAALAALGHASPAAGVSLGVLMCGRAIPTVLCVRAALRPRKSGANHVASPLAAAAAALVAGILLARAGLAPGTAVAALGVLVLRAIALLVFPRPALRARTIGMAELGLGAAFVITVALAWHA